MCNNKYRVLIKDLYTHIWFIARFGYIKKLLIFFWLLHPKSSLSIIIKVPNEGKLQV
jgi:hypothetical protein